MPHQLVAPLTPWQRAHLLQILAQAHLWIQCCQHHLLLIPVQLPCTFYATSVPASQVNYEGTLCLTSSCPTSHTPPQPGRCKRCEKYSKKTRSLSKKHNQLKKKYARLERSFRVYSFVSFFSLCNENNFMYRFFFLLFQKSGARARERDGREGLRGCRRWIRGSRLWIREC